MIQFGLNSIGLVNVLGYKMAALPEWAQRLWSAFSVVPEGGLSQELHASQNLAEPAKTIAPEAMLWTNIQAVQQLSEARIYRPLFLGLPTGRDFFRTVHRFFEGSFGQVCRLAKELTKILIEQMDPESVNLLLGSSLTAVKKELRQIKRLDHWLTGHGANGRQITGPLVGINDLRQGDAHHGESTAKSALQIFGIPDEADDYQLMNTCIIGSVAWSFGCIAETLDTKGPLP
jgi:hypothetical protein